MKLLLHPLMMPLYTFLLYMEIERQSYVINYKTALIVLLIGIILTLLAALIIRKICGKMPFVDVNSSIKDNIKAYLIIVVVNLIITIGIYAINTCTWGVRFITEIYLLPLYINTLSGNSASQLSEKLSQTFFSKCTAAPPASIGALSGYTIIIGYKTCADTFWPFVITLLMITLQATYNNMPPDDETPQNNTGQIFWFIFGAAQAVTLMGLDI